MLHADGCRPPKHIAVKTTFLCTVYCVLADVGLRNGKCDDGNGREEICVVVMNTVQYYTVRLCICTCLWPLRVETCSAPCGLPSGVVWVNVLWPPEQWLSVHSEWPVDKTSEADWFFNLTTTSYQLWQFVAPRSLLQCTCSSSALHEVRWLIWRRLLIELRPDGGTPAATR